MTNKIASPPRTNRAFSENSSSAYACPEQSRKAVRPEVGTQPAYSLLRRTQSVRLLPILVSVLLLLLSPNTAHAQDPDTTPSVSQGSILWVENCQPCHGSTGRGDGPSADAIPDPLPDFADLATAHQLVPAKNFEVIKNGRIESLMPPWDGRLSDAQIWDVTAYVWSLSTTFENITAGEALYQEQCAACHGENGAGDGPEASAGMVDFAKLETMAQRSQTDLRTNFDTRDEHTSLNLSDAELWPTLDYIRTFSFAVPQRNGVLTGQVINGTTNQPQGDLEVTLHAFQDNVEIVTLITQADSDGRYTFEKLPLEHTIFYLVEGEYKDVVYVSDEPGVFTPNSSETRLNLKVYETTTSDEAINIGQLHYIVTFIPNTVNVAQIYIVSNNGNQTFIGQDGQTFAFALPGSATNVSFQEAFPGARFIQTDSGYADTAPITPGAESASIVARYDIPFEAGDLTIEIPLPTDVTSLNVLMSKQGAKLNSGQVQFIETRQIQGDVYQLFGGTNLKRGETLILQLSNLDNLEFANAANAPGTTTPAGQPINQELLRWFIIGLGVVAIVVAGVVYPLTRSQLAHQSSLDYNDPQTQREKLLLTLVRLDEAFEAGELDEGVYRKARARYKGELARIMED